MPYLNEEQLQDGSNNSNTIAPGKSANVVLTEYSPFQYEKNGVTKTMPKHKGTDAESGQEYEFVGFLFHDAVKQLNDAIIPGQTVVNVKCIDNGTKYSDYELTIVAGTEKKAEAPF